MEAKGHIPNSIKTKRQNAFMDHVDLMVTGKPSTRRQGRKKRLLLDPGGLRSRIKNPCLLLPPLRFIFLFFSWTFLLFNYYIGVCKRTPWFLCCDQEEKAS
jgi:hypothetical protein